MDEHQTSLKSETSTSPPDIWKKQNVPYKPHPNGLQNLDVYIPSQPDPLQSSPNQTSKGKYWLIYIHGGAWRDPLITSSSFSPTITHLSKLASSTTTSTKQGTISKIAGLASLNYTLSPHPSHPPSDPKNPDPSRNGHHPDHINDIVTALDFLRDRYFKKGDEYVLIGHSCGATLAFQTLMPWCFSETSDAAGEKPRQPVAIVGLNGLYDLPGLLDTPGEGYEWVLPIYKEFITEAFGPRSSESKTDRGVSVWDSVSPAFSRVGAGKSGLRQTWTRGKVAVVGQSPEDTLVGPPQKKAMEGLLEDEWCDVEGRRQVWKKELKEDHNVIWEDGRELAELLLEVIDELEK